MPSVSRATRPGAPRLARETWVYVVGGFILLFGTISARARGNYEIQVYGADTQEPKSLMVELHSNFTPEGQKYVPHDIDMVLSYREDRDGQILEEGITAAGAMASFTAASLFSIGQ